MSVSPPNSECSVWSSTQRERFCLVCGGHAKGIHFQVSTCRACAAFFRRSVEQSQRYKCRRGTFDCDVSKVAAAATCRRCRFEQCKRVGMVFVIPKPQRSPMECTAIALPIKPDRLLDFKQSITAILLNGSDHQHLLPLYNLNQPSTRILQPLLDAYNSLKPQMNKSNLIISETVNYCDHINFKKTFIRRIAEWAMISPEFRNLPFEEKWTMLCDFWQPMYHFERCARTMEVKGDEWIDCSYLITDNILVSFLTFRFVGFDSSVSEEGIAAAHRYFASVRTHLLSSVIAPFKKMRVTDFEVVFLCVYKMWSVQKLKGISTQTQHLAEAVKNQIADELHEYYMNEAYSKNYAPQLANLMRVMTDLETFLRTKRNTDLSAEVCNIFHCDFRASEFFDDKTE